MDYKILDAFQDELKQKIREGVKSGFNYYNMIHDKKNHNLKNKTYKWYYYEFRIEYIPNWNRDVILYDCMIPLYMHEKDVRPIAEIIFNMVFNYYKEQKKERLLRVQVFRYPHAYPYKSVKSKQMKHVLTTHMNRYCDILIGGAKDVAFGDCRCLECRLARS